MCQKKVDFGDPNQLGHGNIVGQDILIFFGGVGVTGLRYDFLRKNMDHFIDLAVQHNP